ncbi:MAG: extracellular solute-binding protein [Chloroflexi bacterium]|nr:extracellular solute-binding protein [Chloroflexota bacterium]
MPRSRPWLAALSVIAFLISLTAGPLLSDAQAQEPVELRVWDQFTNPTESENAEAIYAAFEEQNPNVTITRESFSTDQMRDVVNTAISSGTGPDVIFYDAGPGYAGVLADADLLLPLEDYASQHGWTERVAEPAIEATTIDGTLYGMPLQTDLIGMYYNQTLLEQEGLEVPQTLDELVTFCGEAVEKGYIPTAFADNDGWPAFHQFSMTANQMVGPDGIQALLNNEGSWDTPEIVTAIEAFFVTLRDAGCFPEDPVAIPYEDGNSLFYNGEALLHTTGSWLIAEIEEQMPDFEVGFVPFPEIEGGVGRVWISGVGSAWYIASATQNPDEAAAFIDYLFSQEAVEQWIEGSRYFVPVEVDTANIEIGPLNSQVIETLQTAGDEGVQFGYNVDVLAPPEFNEMMSSGFQAILVGGKTAEQQAADLEAAWNEGMPASEATPSS